MREIASEHNAATFLPVRITLFTPFLQGTLKASPPDWLRLTPTPEGPDYMKVLLLYPPTPETFWSFKHVLRFVSKRATFPPVHGEFVIEVRRGGDPAPLLLSPMLGKLLVHEKCDFSDGASAGQTGRSPGNWRDPSRSR